MKIELKECFPIEIEGFGTMIDYYDHQFVAIIKDEKWSDTELAYFKKNKLLINLVYERDCLFFLLSVNDVIETSDFIFNVNSDEYDLSEFREFVNGEGYIFHLYLLDQANIVCASKKIVLSTPMSNCLSRLLLKQKSAEYHEDKMLEELAKLQEQYEPFELQEFSIIDEKY